MDETYLGSKKRAKGQPSKRDHDDDQPMGRSGSRKSMVVVATERGGRARAAKGRTHSGRTIAVDRTGTVLVSDELPAYRWNARKQDTDARLASLFTGTAGRLRWKELVA